MKIQLDRKKLKIPPALAAWSFNFGPYQLSCFLICAVSIASARKSNLIDTVELRFRALAIETAQLI